MKGMCSRCCTEDVELFPTNCDYHPEEQPSSIGMHHCYDCGAMVMAGLKHMPLCKQCIERKHPMFDEVK